MMDWLDRTLYPLEAHDFHAPAGKMHDVDEGAGKPVF